VINPDEFEQRLKGVPLLPGVYIWKDTQGGVLYVGKSKALRDRMRSYFNIGQLSNKNRRMVAKIADFDIIVTNSELEALLLEMNLIKQHRPRYNVLLKDDRSYPYIKVTLQDASPPDFDHPACRGRWRTLFRLCRSRVGAAYLERTQSFVCVSTTV
jgi:excinuclease ABC subunit C